MKDLRGFTLRELEEAMEALGERPWRALQVYRWLYLRRAVDIDSMTDISKGLRERLKERFFIGRPDVAGVARSSDGTVKFLTRLAGGHVVESVIIPEAGRKTLCVSTQAGCALSCTFCMTGKAGPGRNLELTELTGQVFTALEMEGNITNVVLMGMGEPLLNYENVVRFTGILVDERGFSFSKNRVTISTAGITPAIERLGKEVDVNLAVSINAPRDELRGRLMPVNRRYPLGPLVEALRRYPLTGKRCITVEYVLLGGVNDSEGDARALLRLLRGIRCKINLIAFNPHPAAPYERPATERVDAFASVLRKGGYTVMTRAGRGADIGAACGQLGEGLRT